MPAPTFSTTLFPDVVGQSFERGRLFTTLRSPMDTAADQSHLGTGSNVLWWFTLAWTSLTTADAQSLLHASNFMGGPTIPLLWFEWIPLAFQVVLVGTGNGSSTTFTLPVKGASAGTTVVYVNNSITAVTFSAATGTNGEDRIVFASAPANGAVIRADFVGRRRRSMRLVDKGSFELSLKTAKRSAALAGECGTHRGYGGGRMNLFPDIIGDSLTIKPAIEGSITEFGENTFSRMRKFLRPRYQFDISLSLLSPASADLLDKHFFSSLGSGFTFDWYFWSSFYWLWVPIGTGDGVKTVWTLPATGTSDQEFHTGAGTIATGTMSYGTGAQGEDQVTVSPAIGAGVSLWFNFTGRRLFTVYYEKDHEPLSRDKETGYYNFKATLVQTK